jgi:hypothetical protein
MPSCTRRSAAVAVVVVSSWKTSLANDGGKNVVRGKLRAHRLDNGPRGNIISLARILGSVSV